MESKSLRELSALYLDSVYDEGCKDGVDNIVHEELTGERLARADAKKQSLGRKKSTRDARVSLDRVARGREGTGTDGGRKAPTKRGGGGNPGRTKVSGGGGDDADRGDGNKAARRAGTYRTPMYDEGYKSYPKEKVDKQKDKAYKKEMIARGGRKTDEKDKEADKQYERRIAMDFKTKMRKYEEEVQREEFKALTPDKKDQIRNQAERRKKSADRAQNASDYKTSTKQDQQVRKMKSVLNNEVEIDFINSLIESGKFSEQDIENITEILGAALGGIAGHTMLAPALAKAGAAGALAKAGLAPGVAKALTGKTASAALGSAAGEVLDPTKKQKDKNPVSAAAGGAAGSAAAGALGLGASYQPKGESLSENPIQKAWNQFVPPPEKSANPNVRSGKLKPGSLEGPLLDKMNKGAAAVNAPIKAVSKIAKDPMGALKKAPPLAKAGLVGAAALGTKAVVDTVMGHGKNSNEGFEFVNKLIESGQFSEEEIVRIIEASAE